MITRARLFQHRAICPWCGAKFSRRGSLRGGRRRCGACRGVIRAIEPANFLGSLVVGVFTGLLTSFLFAAGALIGDSHQLELYSLFIAVPLGACGLAIGLYIGWRLWPYFTPFRALPRQCLKCGYDLRAATGRTCPECGCDQSRYRLATVPVEATEQL